MSRPSSPAISAAQFEALCQLLWGDERNGWQSQAADFLGVSVRNVRFFAAEPPAASKVAPQGIAAELLDEVQRRSADPAERARMEAWLARHEDQGEIMRAALADGSNSPGRPSG